MKNQSIPNVPEIDISRKCWIIRSDGGRYYEHFIKHEIVAIGHIDILNLQDIKDFDKGQAYKKLIERFKASGKTLSDAKRSAGSYLGQATRFLSIKKNDYVITMNHSEIAIGLIVGDAFIGKKDLKVHHSSNNDLNMDLTLRRPVEWQYIVPKEKLSNMLRNTLSTPQTVVMLEDIKKLSIFHTIYPMFLYDSRLHFSIDIEEHRAIKNFHISEIFSLLNEVEFIAREHNAIEENSFHKQFEEFKQQQSLKLEVKASFMSPGEIWANILLNHDGYISIAFFYTLLFGNKIAGFDGIIDKEMRHKLLQLFTDRIEKRQLEKIRKDLKLNKPNHEI